VVTSLIDARHPHVPATTWEVIALLAVLSGIVITAGAVAGLSTAVLAASVGTTGYIFDGHLYITAAILLATSLTLVRVSRSGVADLRPRGARAFGLDLALVAVGFLLYELGRIAVRGNETDAVRNGEHVLSLERALGLPGETAAQTPVLRREWLLNLFNTTYSFLFLATVVGALVWLSLNDAPTYRLVLNALAVSVLISLAVFAVFPVAPPRLTPASGLVDSHARVGLHHGFVNQYAAIPSLHVGWLALVGWGLAHHLGGWRGRLIGALPATAMWVTVVVTGNHYWLDGLVGTVVALTPALLMARADRLSIEARDTGYGLGWSQNGAHIRLAGGVQNRGQVAMLEEPPVSDRAA
jgi:PAP2 superfamily